jgi:hypothetical protein
VHICKVRKGDVVRRDGGGSLEQNDKGVVDILRAALAVVGVRDWDVAVLRVADSVGFWAVASRVRLKAPFAAVAAVVVSVVTGFHTYEAVVAGFGITVFILDEVNFACRRWIGPCARSLCSVERGNRERGGGTCGARLGWYAE